MRSLSQAPAPKASQHGFSMVEILVTLVIIAIALLGTAGLQAYALRMGKSGEFRNQAVFLASDISERMEVNKAGAVAGNYVVAAASAPVATSSNCGLGAPSACDAATLANWDVSQWENSVVAALPQPSWQISRTGTNPSTYTVVIRWTDRSSDKTGSGETFSYTATRTISN